MPSLINRFPKSSSLYVDSAAAWQTWEALWPAFTPLLCRLARAALRLGRRIGSSDFEVGFKEVWESAARPDRLLQGGPSSDSAAFQSSMVTLQKAGIAAQILVSQSEGNQPSRYGCIIYLLKTNLQCLLSFESTSDLDFWIWGVLQVYNT